MVPGSEAWDDIGGDDICGKSCDIKMRHIYLCLVNNNDLHVQSCRERLAL
jgi:hypothetical protein